MPYQITEMLSAENGRPLKLQEIQVGTKILSLDDNLNVMAGKVIKCGYKNLKVAKVSTKLGSELIIPHNQELRSIVSFNNVDRIGIDGCVAAIKRAGVFYNKSIDKNVITDAANKTTIGDIDRLPSWTFDLSKELVAIFLIKVFADKHNNELFGKWSTIFLKGFDLTRDVRALLSKLGIISSIRKVEDPYYTLQVEPDSPGSLCNTIWDSIEDIETIDNAEVPVVQTSTGTYVLDGVVSKDISI